MNRAQRFLAVDQTVAEIRKREASEREAREHRQAAFFHDQHPGRWGDHVSPARMRRDIQKDREEDGR